MNAITQNESLAFKNAAIAQRKASEIAQRPLVKLHAEAFSAQQKYRQCLKMQREAPSPPKQHEAPSHENEAPSPPKQHEAPSLLPYKKRFSAVAVATAADKDAAVEAVATPVDVAPDVVAVATVAPSYDVDDVTLATALLDLAASAPAPDADVVHAATILCEIAASPANAREPQPQQQPLIIKFRRPAAPKQTPLMIKIKKPPRRRAIAPTTARVVPSVAYRPISDVDEKLCGLYPQNDACLGCTLPAGHLGNCSTTKNYDAPRIRKPAVMHNV